MACSSVGSLQSTATTSNSARVLFTLLVASVGLGIVYQFVGTMPGVWLPKTLDQVREQVDMLRALQTTEPMRVLAIFVAIYLVKQTFAIPGSFLLNILGGALYGYTAFFLVCLLTATGATFCYLLSAALGGPLIERFIPHKLEAAREAIRARQDVLIYYLICLRLFPFTPNWLVNVTSAHIGVPLPHFFFSMLIGTIPYNFVSSQAGQMLRELRSVHDVLKPSTLAMLCAMSAAAFLPMLFRERVRVWMESSSTSTTKRD